MAALLQKPGLNRERVSLVAILLLALVLRLINLSSRNLWYDEAFAVLYAEKSFSAILYGTITQVEGAAADVHPLLYYFFLHLWMGLFGQSPFWRPPSPPSPLSTSTTRKRTACTACCVS